MKRYRLYTEARENLPAITARHVSGANISPVQGLWQGALEPGAIIEVIDIDGTLDAAVRACARDIIATNKQTDVLVTVEPIDAFMVSH
jgi:hypothetical protein